MEGLIELVLLLVITAAGWLLLKPALPPFLTRIGNWRVHHVLQRSLPASHYKLFRDLVLRPEVPGEPATPTADEVIVSPYGVFVIANEHMAGVIAGGPGDSRWTCTGWRAQRTFPNPLLRNQVCIRALRSLYQTSAPMPARSSAMLTRDHTRLAAVARLPTRGSWGQLLV